MPGPRVAGMPRNRGEESEMRAAIYAAGALAVLVGGVWMLQGLSVLPGSFMSGQMQWFYVGAIVALAGLALIGWGFRRP